MSVDEAIDTLAALEPLERAHALERLAQKNAFLARKARAMALAQTSEWFPGGIAAGLVAQANAYDLMLATLKEIRFRYSPLGRPGALIDETIRQVEGRKA
jgi:hypothetical protein